MYGVENSSMFLECSPKSQRALIYWQLQNPDDGRRLEVSVGGSEVIGRLLLSDGEGCCVSGQV